MKISHKGAPAIAADAKQGAVDLVITNTEVVDEFVKAGDVPANGKSLRPLHQIVPPS